MPEAERRVDIVNNLNLRLSILEAAHSETVRARLLNEGVITSLKDHDASMLLELQTISTQLSTGLKVLLGCSAVMVTVLGGFWKYSNDLDTKYARKTDQATVSITQNSQRLQKQNEVISVLNKDVDAATDKVDAATDKVDQQQDAVDGVVSDVQVIKKKRVFKASR